MMKGSELKKDIYFLQDDDKLEKYHPIVQLDYNKIKMRGRSEILVIKDWREVYLSEEKHGLCCENLNNGFVYDVVGGGWIPGESHDFTAYREACEEARLKTTHIKEFGYYTVMYEEPKEWIKKKISQEHWWYGYFTEVFVGLYDGKYTGKIDEKDMDKIINTGKFYPIEEVIKLMNPIHKEAIISYLSYKPLIHKYWRER